MTYVNYHSFNFLYEKVYYTVMMQLESQLSNFIDFHITIQIKIMSKNQRHHHHERENFAAETLKQISDIPSYLQTHIGKLDFLCQNFEDKNKRTIKSANPLKRRNIVSAQGKIRPTIRIYQNIELQHFFGVPSTLKFHITNRDKAQKQLQLRNEEIGQNGTLPHQNFFQNPQSQIFEENIGSDIIKAKNKIYNHKRFISTRQTRQTRNKSTIRQRKLINHNKNSCNSINRSDKTLLSEREAQLQTYKKIRHRMQQNFSIGGQSYFKENANFNFQKMNGFHLHGSLKQIIENSQAYYNKKKQDAMNTISYNTCEIGSPRSHNSSPSQRKNVSMGDNGKRVYMGRPIYSSKQKKKLNENKKMQRSPGLTINQDLPMGYRQRGIGGNKVIFNI